MAEEFDPYYQWLGIAPRFQPPNHYRLLGVDEFEANLDVIENAADRQIAHVRLFQSGPRGDLSQRLLNEITAAKLCLLNRAKKDEYDQKLYIEKAAAGPPKAQSAPPLVRDAAAAWPQAIEPPIGETPPSVPDAPDTAPDMPLPVTPSLHHKRFHPGRGTSLQQAAMAGTVLGILIVAVFFYLAFTGEREDTAVNIDPGKAPTQRDPSAAEIQPFETKTKAKINKTDGPPPKVDPNVTDQATVAPHNPGSGVSEKPEPVRSLPEVYLDDLKEADSKVGYGTLGKHGELGYDNRAAMFQGRKIPHLLSMHPPANGVAYATYNLNGEYKALRATAALMDIENEPMARSPVMFKVFADGRLLWNSHTIQRLGTGEECALHIDGVKTLRLEADCLGGDMSLASAAWLNPLLTKAPLNVPPSNVVYLDDLKEKESKIHFGAVGKHGARGHTFPNTNHEALFQGRKPAHALSLHAADNGSVSVTYELDGKHAFLRGTAGLLNVTQGFFPATPATFKIFGDGRRLWQSKPIGAVDIGQAFSVDIRKAKTMRLEVDCPGSANLVHAAWLYAGLTNAPPGSITAMAAARWTVPAALDLDGARKRVKEIFPQDYAEAQTQDLKLALAEKLWVRATEFNDPLPVKYALLEEIKRFAIEISDVQLALQANKKLVSDFELDGPAISFELFTRLEGVNLTAAKRKALMDAVLDATQDAATAGNLKAARELADLAQNAAAKTADAELRRNANALHERIEQFHAWWQDAEKARKILAEKPAQANAALGKYLCFVIGDWETGLAHLADSDDAKWKAAAELDLAGPSRADQQTGVGDAWWDLATSATGQTRLALQRRAEYWYKQAINELKGQVKTTVEKRLAKLPLPPAARVSRWETEGGVVFKFSERGEEVRVELDSDKSKLYSKIEVVLKRAGELWSGVGDLYFRSTPERRYEAKVEVSGDIFGGTKIQVRTICPDATMRKKVIDATFTWKRKD
jgi:hypothetical protein